MSILELKTKVLSGGRIEVQAPGLPEGREVTVQIVLSEEAQTEKKTLRENLAGYEGGQLFKTAAEVKAYLKEERDS